MYDSCSQYMYVCIWTKLLHILYLVALYLSPRVCIVNWRIHTMSRNSNVILAVHVTVDIGSVELMASLSLSERMVTQSCAMHNVFLLVFKGPVAGLEKNCKLDWTGTRSNWKLYMVTTGLFQFWSQLQTFWNCSRLVKHWLWLVIWRPVAPIWPCTTRKLDTHNSRLDNLDSPLIKLYKLFINGQQFCVLIHRNLLYLHQVQGGMVNNMMVPWMLQDLDFFKLLSTQARAAVGCNLSTRRK